MTNSNFERRSSNGNILCACGCGKEAVWIYMPGYGNASSPYDNYKCDDCVSKEPIIEADDTGLTEEEFEDLWNNHPEQLKMVEIRDEDGEIILEPNGEYMYDEDGFNFDLDKSNPVSILEKMYLKSKE